MELSWSYRNCRRLAWLSACVVLLFAAGCNSDAASESDLNFELTFEPSPPKVGEANVTLKVTDSSGAPVEGADIELEGNMNHAGMVPSPADLEESEPGQYDGTMDFTMGGDWFVLITGKTSDGGSIEHKIDVPGVEAP